MRPRPRLVDYAPEGARLSSDAILDRFLAWIASRDLEPYPAQEEALLELMSGNHVVLSTPTGSGKSLVALGLHWKAFCEGRRSFYTAPIKALVSEKFFDLCEEFGPENVGMLTGDASINWAAPVICCTAEVLANMALRQGERADAPYVVMDEFHYYAERDRGWAWQVPLLVLGQTRFLLMSATLGNTASIEERLRDFTGRPVAHVHSEERPVPLDYEYRETSLLDTVEGLLQDARAPIYIVHFTQREAAEQAQGLTSAAITDRDEKRAISQAIGDFRFDTPYGKDVQRILRFGVGLHHAGLLPKYRLLVEQLAQRGLLKVICGTDTLGVGVNIPIRTVLFSKLSKFDGEKVGILSVRDFKQISGRAGRKGFDDRGSVVCQAPEHVVENKRSAEKQAGAGRRKPAKKKAAPRGFVAWNQDTFQKLIYSPPETLESRFRVTHGMLVSLLQRGREEGLPGSGYRELGQLIEQSHEPARRRRRLRREAAALFRSLRQAGVVECRSDPERAGSLARVSGDLQRDFGLHQTLSLYLVEAIAALDPEDPDYALQVLTLAEAILPNPRALLHAQVQTLKSELMARLKAERVPYEERLAKLDEVTWPRPDAEFIHTTFALFSEKHPWVGEEAIHPKNLAREMVESCAGFDDTVKRYGLARMEGVLLRYLSQVHGTLARSVPEAARSEEVEDVIAYLRALIARVDSSLVDEWESLVHPGVPAEPPPESPLARRPVRLDRRQFEARVRAELHQLVRALVGGDFEEAAACVEPCEDDAWDAARFEAALAPFLAECGHIVFDPPARANSMTLIRERGPRRWDVYQSLMDPEGQTDWHIEGEIALVSDHLPEGPLVRMRAIAR
ncbi:MAG: DEAD/DEAH box helicase [Myxococcota bacterium]